MIEKSFHTEQKYLLLTDEVFRNQPYKETNGQSQPFTMRQMKKYSQKNSNA